MIERINMFASSSRVLRKCTSHIDYFQGAFFLMKLKSFNTIVNG